MLVENKHFVLASAVGQRARHLGSRDAAGEATLATAAHRRHPQAGECVGMGCGCVFPGGGREPRRRSRVPRQSGPCLDCGNTRVKTYDIEVQRLKSAKHDKGLIELGVDAAVLQRAVRDEETASSVLRLPVEHARTLLILLKQQLAELDKLQPRSRRSGRC